MSPKEAAKNSIAQKAGAPANLSNGAQTPDEHLSKANKAMAKAWSLIARRQDKSD